MANITRRQFMTSISAGASTLMLSSCMNDFQRPGNSPNKPNIIYILADDLGYGDLGCYGQEKIRTPRLDQMAADGMRFTQHYAGSTVCAPSRCCLMTGLHTGHAFIRGNHETQGYQLALPQDTVTVAKLMQNAGYTTGMVGKWGLGGPDTPGAPNRQGFDFFYGYLGQVQAHFYYPDHLWRNNERVKLDGKTYTHDLLTEEALGFIRRNQHRPFFLYVPFTIPHAEVAVPQDSLEPYLGEFPETPFQGRDGGYGSHETPKAAFAGMISRMDRDVGKILDVLHELGLDENTLVFFSSDNGPHQEGGADPKFFNSSGPLRGIKRDLYEGGIRVPLIARWPGKVRTGSVSNHISTFWDFLPTCTELAGAKTPKDLDGISFLPSLLEQPQKQHEYLYWEFTERGGKQAVRMGPWKGVRLNIRRNPENPLELYNLDNDLAETQNIATDYPDIIEKLEAIIKNARTDSPEFPLVNR